MHKLLQLRQTGTVAEYRAAFDEHMHHLLALDPSINTKFFVTQFLLSLKDELCAPVRLQAPSSITRASVLARIQEEEMGTTHARPRITPSSRPPPATAAAATPQRGAVAPLLTINVGDHGEVLSDDTIHALQLLDDPGPAAQPPVQAADAPECCLISSQALDGTNSTTTIRLRVLVGNQVMLLLLDSGITHSFVNKAFIDRLGPATEEMPPTEVRMDNDDKLTCNRMVPDLKWWMQGHPFATPMRELEIGAYDGILGMN
ncbi:hypothetical protein VPH35_008891 [Triticum aestivum]